MKGKSITIPLGMIIKKHYCCNCGSKLCRNKTHRVVTKDDKDYYSYAEYGNFPRYDYDVYSYEFTCNVCKRNISYNEQRVLERIQKKFRKKILTSDEIENRYLLEKQKHLKCMLIRRLLFISFVISIFIILYFLFATDKTFTDILICLILFILFMSYSIFANIRSFYGKNKLRKNQNYSVDEKNKFEKLHAYSKNNKEQVQQSEYCYCFHCLKKISSSEITTYSNNTAICPKCGYPSLLSDSINEPLDYDIINQMNKYWY